MDTGKYIAKTSCHYIIWAPITLLSIIKKKKINKKSWVLKEEFRSNGEKMEEMHLGKAMLVH